MNITEKEIELIKKYSVRGPRYTSYPTAPEWGDDFSGQNYFNFLNQFLGQSSRELSLYVHFPYCLTKCHYCGCNSQLLINENDLQKYIKFLGLEVKLFLKSMGKVSDNVISSIHIGGGSPSILKPNEFKMIMGLFGELGLKRPLREFSIELDPRYTSIERLQFYSSMGIDRVSFGIQDFDHQVQQAIGRIQKYDDVKDLLFTSEIKKLFKSINFDLIYGLPMQTSGSFRKTIELVLKLEPSRIAIYNYAHMPKLLSNQSNIEESSIPDAGEKVRIFYETTRTLMRNGYKYIGMDHFSKPEDDLYIAQKQNRLKRNFMGYTTSLGYDYIGLGPSAISGFGNCYFQNSRNISVWTDLLKNSKMPICKGIELSKDDLIRRSVINSIICNFELDFDLAETQYGIIFQKYFKNEIIKLKPLIDDGLIDITKDSLRVTTFGKFVVRNICMVFDKYLEMQGERRFSKTV